MALPGAVPAVTMRLTTDRNAKIELANDLR